MDQEILAQVLGLFGGHEGTAAKYLAWYVAITTAAKLVTDRIAAFVNRAISAAVETKELEDDGLVLKFLRNPFYRGFAWLVDVTTRVKLPRELPTASPAWRASDVVRSLVLAVGLSAIAFATSGCGSLDKTGVYEGDKVLYSADRTISEAYEVTHAFVKWEYQNRALLKDSPEITQAANAVRDGARKWINTAIALRDAYEAVPNEPNRDALQSALSILRQMMNEAAQYMARPPSK